MNQHANPATFTEADGGPNPLSPKELAKTWRAGDTDDRAMVERLITRWDWWHLFRYDREGLLIRIPSDDERAAWIGASAGLSLRLAGGERYRAGDDA